MLTTVFAKQCVLVEAVTLSMLKTNPVLFSLDNQYVLFIEHYFIVVGYSRYSRLAGAISDPLNSMFIPHCYGK